MKATLIARIYGARVYAAVVLIVSASAAESGTFTNPLLPSGPDPWAIHKDGWYYYTHTTGRNLTLWRTRQISDLERAERRVIWTPPERGPYSKNIWAPELHFIGNKWYLYFAADDGRNRNHRIYLLENSSPDPFSENWTMLGQVHTPEDKWAIDASVFQHGGQLYLLWSGWEGDENGRQDIYLSRLANPWTTEGPRVRISSPTYAWERIGDIAKPGPDDKPHVDVNEGPEALIRHGRVFVIFSASGCWTEQYSLGMVYARATANLMNAASWHKVDHPVFTTEGRQISGTFAAGHNSFFRSPDGTEDWILYHANPKPGMGCGPNRSPRAQPFRWRADGFPDFGTPVAAGVPLPSPSSRKAASAAARP